MFVKEIFVLLSVYTPLCNNFNMTEFKTNIWHFYHLQEVSQWGILYVVAGIIIPIIIQICINKAKMMIGGKR